MKRFFAVAIFVAVMGLLLVLSARAAAVDGLKNNSVEGIVVPDTIYDGQPFSFAAPQSSSVGIQGEVISVESVSGVVVQQAAADKYGRVFLPAGLPAGAYLILRSSGHQPVGTIEIKQRAADALERPWERSSEGMQLQNPPQALKLSDPFSLSGHGFSSNFADTRVTLTGMGKNQAPMVLAATEDQLKLTPVQQLEPGAVQLRVTNQATGQSTDSYQLLLYDIKGTLVRRAIKSGNDETQLVITVKPDNAPLKIKVNVASGPVDFGDGRKEAEGFTSNGQAVFPVHAEKGSGPFQVNWRVEPLAATNGDQQAHTQSVREKVRDSEPFDFPQPSSYPVSAPRQDHGNCHCRVSAGGGTNNLAASASERPAPKELDLSPLGSEQQQDEWAKRRKERPMFEDYLGTAKFTFDILEATVVAQGDNDDHIDVQRTTWLTIGGWDNIQVFRKGNKGYLPINGRGDRLTLYCPRDQKTFKRISGEEYRVELWGPKSTPAPATVTIQVDVGDAITPCDFTHHQTASYELTFNRMGVTKVRKLK